MGKIKKAKKKIQAKQEKKNLHAKYICGIVLGISLACVILSAYNHETFVSQFAFAGTVASTVLSIVAIWVSISSEKGKVQTQHKILSAANRLKKATKKAKATGTWQETVMDGQLKQLEDIQKKLALFVDYGSKAKEEAKAPCQEAAKINYAPCGPALPPPNAGHSRAIFENLYGWIQEDGQNMQSLWIFCKMFQLIAHYRQSQSTYALSDILSQLSLSGVQTSHWLAAIHVHWGTLNALAAAGVLDDPEALPEITEKAQGLLQQNFSALPESAPLLKPETARAYTRPDMV